MIYLQQKQFFIHCLSFLWWFRWSPEDPVSQIHSHLLVGAPGIFSDLLRFVKMLKREWGAERNRTYSSLVKLQPRFLSLQWKTCVWAELQPWCPSLQWRTCHWAEHWWWCLSLTNGCARVAHCVTARWRDFSHYCRSLRQYYVWFTCSDHREALTARRQHTVYANKLLQCKDEVHSSPLNK